MDTSRVALIVGLEGWPARGPIVEHLLARGVRAELATPAEALKKLGQNAFRLLVIAGTAPDSSGVRALREAVCPELPEVVLSPSAPNTGTGGLTPIPSQEPWIQALEEALTGRNAVATAPPARPEPGPDAVDLQRQLQKLGDSFRASMPQRVSQLRAEVTAFLAGQCPAEAAIQSAHKIHGTAGSHGLGRLGRAAGALEHALEAAAPAGEIERALSKLEQVTAIATRTPGGVR